MVEVVLVIVLMVEVVLVIVLMVAVVLVIVLMVEVVLVIVLVVEVVLVIVLVVEVILVEPSVQCVHNDLLLGCTLGEGLIGIFEGEDAWSTVAPHSLAGH